MARYVCWHNFLLLNMVCLSCVLCILVVYLFVCGSIFVSYLYPGRDPASSHQGLPHKPPITGGTTPFHVLCIKLTIRYNVSIGEYIYFHTLLVYIHTRTHFLSKTTEWVHNFRVLKQVGVDILIYFYSYILLWSCTLFMQNHWLGDHLVLTLHITPFSVTININKVQ